MQLKGRRLLILVQVARKFINGGEEMAEIPEVLHYNHSKGIDRG